MQAIERDGLNLALIGRIVAVATIGGFMFGYDSGNTHSRWARRSWA